MNVLSKYLDFFKKSSEQRQQRKEEKKSFRESFSESMKEFFAKATGKYKLSNQEVSYLEGAAHIGKFPLRVSFGGEQDKNFFSNTEKLRHLETLPEMQMALSDVHTTLTEASSLFQESVGIQKSTFSMWANFIGYMKNRDELKSREDEEKTKSEQTWRDKLLTFFDTKFEEVADASGGGGGGIGSLIGGALSMFGRGGKGLFRGIASLFRKGGLKRLAVGALSKIKGFFSLKGLARGVRGLGGFFKKVVGKLWGGIRKVFSLSSLKRIVGSQKGGILKRLGSMLKGFVGGIWKLLKNLFSSKILKALGGLGRFLTKGIGKVLWSIGRLALRGIAAAVGGVPAAIIAAIVAALWAIWEYVLPDEWKDKIIDALKAAWETAIDWFSKGIEYLVDAWKWIANGWDSVVNGVWDFAKGVGNFATKVWDMGKKLWDGYTNALSSIWEFITGIPKWVGEKMKVVKETAIKAFEGYISWLTSLWDWVTDIPGKIWGWIKETFMSSPIGKLIGWSVDQFKSLTNKEEASKPNTKSTVEEVNNAVHGPRLPERKVEVLQKDKTGTIIRVSEKTDPISGRVRASTTPVVDPISGSRSTSTMARRPSYARSEAPSGIERVRTYTRESVVERQETTFPQRQYIPAPGRVQSPTMSNTPIIVEDSGLMLINVGAAS